MLNNLNIELWDIINIVTASIDWIIFFLLIDSIGKKKESNISYIFGIITIFIFMAFINGCGIFPNNKIIICIVVGTIFYILMYKDKIHKCILVSLLFWLSLIISDVLASMILVTVNKLSGIHILLSGNALRVQFIIVAKILLFIGLILIKYFKLSLELKFKDFLLIGLPIVANISSLLLIFGYNMRNEFVSSDNIIILMFTTILIVSSSIVLLIVIGKIVQDDKIKLENELINERIRKNHTSYENINQMHDKVKYVYHDLKNHIICINSYNTKEEILEYVNSLEFQISDFENFKNTGNKTLDIILGEKIYLCKKYNIESEDSVNISRLNFIQDNDICAIFANALDNAIEACMNIDNEVEKRIEVKATYVNGFAIIKFINTKVNDIKFIDERIQTSKNDDQIHGIGLSSIKYIVNKYDGETIVNYSDNEFILKIMIPIKT